MANTPVNIGSKFYNIYYGPMTVVGIDQADGARNRIICCTVDDPNGLSERIRIPYEMSYSVNRDRPQYNNGKYVKWFESDIGRLLFSNPKEAENIACAEPHTYFGGLSGIVKETSESAVGMKKELGKESAVGLKGSVAYPGESGVGIKK